MAGQFIIIGLMKVLDLHSWQTTVSEAREIQLKLTERLSLTDEVGDLSLIAGVDVSPRPGGEARGAVVVLRYPELEVVEVQTTQGKLEFPYIPGLLSFRESPLILAACEKLRSAPGLLFVDGQGIAHPRRFGLASHLGLLLDIPSIGCAKSLLCGYHNPVANEVGSYSNVIDNGEVIGIALRTRINVRLMYVSIGHKVDLEAAQRWVLDCSRGYRLPEPCRLAHLLATKGAVPSSPEAQDRLFSKGG